METEWEWHGVVENTYEECCFLSLLSFHFNGYGLFFQLSWNNGGVPIYLLIIILSIALLDLTHVSLLHSELDVF